MVTTLTMVELEEHRDKTVSVEVVAELPMEAAVVWQ